MFIIIRIIAGANRGFHLKTKDGLTTRPTLDRIRENVFNIIKGKVAGAEVLDLFAGSGAVGLEALSRGAKSAVFVEKDREAYRILKENIQKTKSMEKSKSFHESYDHYLRTCRNTFDIIYVDPPYELNAYQSVLEKLARHGCLREEGILILESHKEAVVPMETEVYECFRNVAYGNTKIYFYIKKTGGTL